MSKQPKALQLADSLDSYGMPRASPSSIAARLLRRQHALIAELVEAMEKMLAERSPVAQLSDACQSAVAALSQAKDQYTYPDGYTVTINPGGVRTGKWRGGVDNV